MDRAERTRKMGLLNAVEYEKAQDDQKVAAMRAEAAKLNAALAAETFVFEVRNRESQVRRQQLVVTELERQVDALGVKSPVNGLVSRVEVADRDSVGLGQPLVGVVDLSRLEIEVWVPESYAPDIKPGTAALINIDGRDWPGEVARLSPEVEGSRVRGTVAFSGGVPPGLKQNQRVSGRLRLETRHNVLKVPRGPFLEALGERQAYVVEDDVAVRRPIEVGSVSVSEVEITSGLREGEEIVLSDPSTFENAQRVLLRR
jgi:HlyD family secretion protein